MTTPIENGTLGTKLLSLLMQYIRHENKFWGLMTSEEQQEVLEGMQERIDDTLREGVIGILSGGLPKITGKLKSVVAANGVRATIDIAGGISEMSTEALHNLVDRCGSSVVIVLVGPEEHQVEIEKFVTMPDQPSLPLTHAAGTLADPLCICGHLQSSHCGVGDAGVGCTECVCELFEPAPEVKCDEKHDSPVCADPNCWQSPDTTVGADEEDDDDE